ncbi:MAG: M23 family metallopeptidase, partial [Ruminococcaceae bacterium]|nr:M23 family metallopeptidase [Oscillospiraceae bacterium]
YNGGYGTTVLIDHGDGVQTLYAHLDGLAVTPGEFVQAGQTIARVGMTGVVTGPCLHFEVRVNDVAVDPLKYLDVLMDEAETIVDGEEKCHIP